MIDGLCLVLPRNRPFLLYNTSIITSAFKFLLEINIDRGWSNLAFKLFKNLFSLFLRRCVDFDFSELGVIFNLSVWCKNLLLKWWQEDKMCIHTLLEFKGLEKYKYFQYWMVRPHWSFRLVMECPNRYWKVLFYLCHGQLWVRFWSL